MLRLADTSQKCSSLTGPFASSCMYAESHILRRSKPEPLDRHMGRTQTDTSCACFGICDALGAQLPCCWRVNRNAATRMGPQLEMRGQTPAPSASVSINDMHKLYVFGDCAALGAQLPGCWRANHNAATRAGIQRGMRGQTHGPSTSVSINDMPGLIRIKPTHPSLH